MRRFIGTLALVILLGMAADLAILATAAHAQEKDDEVTGTMQSVAWTQADTHQAINLVAFGRGVSYSRLDCIVRRESGYSPYAVGSQGELGSVQLHPRGALLAFYARGYDDPFNPYQSVDFLGSELAAGRGGQWTASRSC